MSANVGPRALVLDYAKVYGSANVHGEARVYDNARVYDRARVYDNARICDRAQIFGDAWVYDHAQVSGDARVYGDACVFGDAYILGQGDVSSTRHYLTIGPVGSEDRTVTIHRHYDGPGSTKWGHLVVAGCWSGTLDELAARIAGDPVEWAYGVADDRAWWRLDYAIVITAGRARASEWESEPLTAEDHERQGSC